MRLTVYGGNHPGRWFAHGQYEFGVDPPLNACPFCGGREICFENTYAPAYRGECASCGATGPICESAVESSDGALPRDRIEVEHHTAFERAVRAWNRAG